MARPSPASAGGEGEAAAADQEHRLENFRRACADMLTDTALPTSCHSRRTSSQDRLREKPELILAGAGIPSPSSAVVRWLGKVTHSRAAQPLPHCRVR